MSGECNVCGTSGCVEERHTAAGLGDALNESLRAARRGYHLVSEGQAVIEGRVVEMEGPFAGFHVRSSRSGAAYYPPSMCPQAEFYRVKPERSDRHTEVTHACPRPEDSGIMPCCGRTPFQYLSDHMTLDPALVTCTGEEHTEGETGDA